MGKLGAAGVPTHGLLRRELPSAGASFYVRYSYRLCPCRELCPCSLSFHSLSAVGGKQITRLVRDECAPRPSHPEGPGKASAWVPEKTSSEHLLNTRHWWVQEPGLKGLAVRQQLRSPGRGPVASSLTDAGYSQRTQELVRNSAPDLRKQICRSAKCPEGICARAPVSP